MTWKAKNTKAKSKTDSSNNILLTLTGMFIRTQNECTRNARVPSTISDYIVGEISRKE